MKAKYSKGDILFREGDSSKELYIIEEGIVKIYKMTNKMELIPISVATKGEFIGELSFFDGRNRSATAEAVTSTETIKITQDMLKKELTKYPSWVFTLIQTLSKRLRDVNDLMKRHKIVDEEMKAKFQILSHDTEESGDADENKNPSDDGDPVN